MPTIKQKQAFKEVVAGSSLTKAMRKAHYSIETSKRTNKLTRTKGWQELLDKHLPDKLLAKRHRELLNKREVITVYSHESGEKEAFVSDQPDTNAVSRALDMGYKLKGSYAPDKHLNLSLSLSDILKKAKEPQNEAPQ